MAQHPTTAQPRTAKIRMPGQTTKTEKRVYIRTFGCQMNVYDTGKMKALLARDGYVPTDDPDEPGFEDPTCLAVVAFIPTLSPALLVLMALLLAALGVAGLTRRRANRPS